METYHPTHEAFVVTSEQLFHITCEFHFGLLLTYLWLYNFCNCKLPKFSFPLAFLSFFSFLTGTVHLLSEARNLICREIYLISNPWKLVSTKINEFIITSMVRFKTMFEKPNNTDALLSLQCTIQGKGQNFIDLKQTSINKTCLYHIFAA